jgi:hypothetical protein
VIQDRRLPIKIVCAVRVDLGGLWLKGIERKNTLRKIERKNSLRKIERKDMKSIKNVQSEREKAKIEEGRKSTTRWKISDGDGEG